MIDRKWRDQADVTPSFNIGAVQRSTAESGGSCRSLFKVISGLKNRQEHSTTALEHSLT